MQSLRLFAALLLLGSAIPVAVQARAPSQRSIANIAIDATSERVSSLAGLRPNGRWVLIVLDAHRFSGQKYTDALKTAGYEGKNAIVLVIGDVASAKAVSRRSLLLPEAQWVTARAAVSLKELGLLGTPAVFGMDAEHVVWQMSGMQPQAGHLAVQMADWINSMPHQPTP